MRKKLFSLLWLIGQCNFLAAQTAWFPQGCKLFKKLTAEPEEVKTIAQYFTLHGLDTVDISLGNSWGFYRWGLGTDKSWLFQLDVSGVMTPRFLVSTNLNQKEFADLSLRL